MRTKQKKRKKATIKGEMLFVRITERMQRDAERTAAEEDMTLSEWVRLLIRLNTRKAA